MSTTSIFLQYFLPPANTLKAKLSFYIRKDRSSLPLNQSHASRASGRQGMQSNPDGIDGPYRNLTDRGPLVSDREEYDLGLYLTQTVKTNVIAEPFEHIDEDGIHLRVDMEQD